jgi:UPF0271 protein
VFARAAGSRVAYVKPHGALYNRVVGDEEQAAAVVEGIRRADPSLPVLGMAGSALHRAAEAAGSPTVKEAFADRAYTAAGTLVSRREPGAVLHDEEDVVARSVRMAGERVVVAVTGELVPVEARSLCVHGDTPSAARLARRIHAALSEAGTTVEPFA